MSKGHRYGNRSDHGKPGDTVKVTYCPAIALFGSPFEIVDIVGNSTSGVYPTLVPGRETFWCEVLARGPEPRSRRAQQLWAVEKDARKPWPQTLNPLCLQSIPPMQESIPRAHKRDTPAVSHPQLNLSVRLCGLPQDSPQVCKGVAYDDRPFIVLTETKPICSLGLKPSLCTTLTRQTPMELIFGNIYFRFQKYVSIHLLLNAFGNIKTC